MASPLNESFKTEDGLAITAWPEGWEFEIRDDWLSRFNELNNMATIKRTIRTKCWPPIGIVDAGFGWFLGYVSVLECGDYQVVKVLATPSPQL